MNKIEMNVLTIAGVVGFSTIWYCIGSQAAGWAFIAGVAVVGECANALAARLEKMRQAIESSNVLRGRGE